VTEEVVEKKSITAETDLLLAKTGHPAGKIFSIEGNETIIGAHGSADIYMYAPGIPEVHSKIIFDGNVYLIVKNSENDNTVLKVNDMEIDSIDLRDGDEISIGEFEFEFIEKGTSFDPYPYIVKAEEERRAKLQKEIENKKIRSVHDTFIDDDDDEVTEVKRAPKRGAISGLFNKIFNK